MIALPFTLAVDGARLAVRVVPKSSAARIVGLVADSGGASALKIALHAPPENGKANVALLRLLADTLRLPLSALTLAHGAAQRRKLVHIGGDPVRLKSLLEAKLAPWLHG